MNDYCFGNFVCMLREKKGLTQAEIAQKLGVTPAAVSKWENGSSKPRVEILFQLADILEVKPEELMAGRYIVEETLNPDAVRQINERYKYLRKIDSYNTTNVKMRRLLAWIIDWNVVGFPVIAILGICLSFFETRATAPSYFETFPVIFIMALYPVFFVLRDLIMKGRSIGKRITGLIVLDKSTGETAKPLNLFVRNLFLFIMQIDAIVLLISGQSIGDRVAHTAVVLKKDFENAECFKTESDAQMINSYVAPEPLTKKRVAIIVSVIILAVVLFIVSLIVIITMALNAQKNTEEYKLAYNYLVESSLYDELDINEDSIKFNSYSANFSYDKNGNEEKTVEFGFILDDKDVYVICHYKDNEWLVCSDCTVFD